MVDFSISTLNLDGIRDDDKRAQIFEYLRSLKYDFYLPQETQVQVQDIEAFFRRIGGGGGGGGGLASGILVATNPGVWG